MYCYALLHTFGASAIPRAANKLFVDVKRVHMTGFANLLCEFDHSMPWTTSEVCDD